MLQESYGMQDVRFFKHRVKVVLLELLADELLKGCQFYLFKEYKKASGDCILGGHANGLPLFKLPRLEWVLARCLYFHSALFIKLFSPRVDPNVQRCSVPRERCKSHEGATNSVRD